MRLGLEEKIEATYSLGHTNTGILDGKSLVFLVRDNVDAEVFPRVEF